MPTLLPKVLIVEDDPAIRGLLTAALRREPLSVDAAADGVAALDCIREAATDYAVIVTDLMLPRLDGAAFLEAMLALRPNARSVIFVMTAFDDVTAKRINAPVHALIRKPFDVKRLVDMIRECAVLRSEAGELPAADPLAEGGGDAPHDVC